MKGEKYMRSLASMYFILRLMSILVFQTISLSASAGVLYTSHGIMIALVRPYKEMYMNIIDTLIMVNLALLALALDRHYLEDSILHWLYCMQLLSVPLAFSLFWI